MRCPPRNNLKREDRVRRWQEDAAQAQPLRPNPVSGKNARWTWLDSLYGASELSATERHVGMVLALFADSDGTRIWPTVETVASRCNLSERVISKSISQLVRSGRLQRKYRDGRAGAGGGFVYILMVPTVLTQDQHPVLTERQHHAAMVLTQDQHLAQVLTQRQHGADAHADGADANDSKVLTQRQPTSSVPIQIPGAGTTPAAPGELAQARPARRKSSTNVVTLEPVEERVRKARKHIDADPGTEDATIAQMYRLGPEEIRKVRAG